MSKIMIWVGQFDSEADFEKYMDQSAFRQWWKDYDEDNKELRCTYYFDVKNQIIEIREGLELKNQFYYTFFIYEKELMKTIAYDNSKRIVNVRYYLYGSNGKIEKMYSKGSRGSREETYFYENDRLQKIVIRQFDRNDIEQDTLQHSFDYKSNGELKSIILSTELYSETIYQET